MNIFCGQDGDDTRMKNGLLKNQGYKRLQISILCILAGAIAIMMCQANRSVQNVNGRQLSTPKSDNGSKNHYSQSSLNSASHISVPDMEVLYARYQRNLSQTQICVLNLPSRKVEVILDTNKMQKRLDNILGESIFSPDGQYILFTGWAAGLPAETRGGYGGINELSDLWVFNRRTKSLRQLTTDWQGYDSLKWSPDGRYISACGLRRWTTPETPPTETGGCYPDLYVWDMRTTRRRLVLNNVNREQWAPDGGKLFALRNDWLLYIWDAQTGKKRLVAEDVKDAFWMPNKGLLFQKHYDDILWYSPTVGGDVKPFLPDKEIAALPAVSPDGTKIVYLDNNNDCILTTIASGKSRLLMKAGGGPYWSPDGRKIVVVTQSAARGNDPYTTYYNVLDAYSGKSITRQAFNDNADSLGWTQDGRTIIVINRTRKRTIVDGKTVDFVDQPQRLLAVSTETEAVRDMGVLPTTDILQSPTYWDWRLAVD